MKLRMTKEALDRGLSLAGKSVNSRSPLPVMAMVLIDARDGLMLAGANAVFTTVVTGLVGEVEEPGACCVPAERLMSYVATLPAGADVVLNANDVAMKLKAGKSKASFPVMQADEFAELPEKRSGFMVDGGELRSLLEKALKAASNDRSATNLNAVYLQGNGEDLFVASADGYRAVMVVLEGPSDVGEWLLPKETVQAILRTDGENIEIASGRSKLTFFDGRTLIGTALNYGAFPGIRAALPKIEAAMKTQVLVEREALKRAVQQCMVFGGESNNLLNLNFTDGMVLVSATGGSGVGDGESEVRCDIEGPDAQIGFNGKYVMDALDTLETERVVLSIIDPTVWVVFRELGENSFRHVVVPMNLNRKGEE
jgi:DNA polymerase III subunit beta